MAAGPLATAAPPWRLERRRGVASRLGRAGPGRPWAGAPGQAVAFSSARLRRPKAAVGQLFPRAGPVVIGKIVFGFSFIIWEEKYFGKCLCTHFGSKFVETNFVVFLVTRST